MMHDEHEMMFLVGKLQQAHPEQRARIQFEGGLVNSSGNILGPPLSAVRRLTADVVKLDPGQLRAVDHLRRHFADQLEMSPNTLMPADDFVKTPFHVPDVEFADKFNSMPKYVVSSTLEQPEWTNSTVVNGDDLVDAVSKLKQEVDGDVVVHGSAQLVQALLEHDLVDELRLMVFPVVLGTGKRLFGDPADKKTLRLVDSNVVGDGVVILTYSAAAPE